MPTTAPWNASPQLFESEGKNRDQVNELQAGDIGCTVKLKNSHTNQTLNPKGSETKIERIHFPTPRIRMAVVPPSKADVEKMAHALHSIQEEDPTLLVEQSMELKQTIVQGQGEMHLEIVRTKPNKISGCISNLSSRASLTAKRSRKRPTTITATKNNRAAPASSPKYTCASSRTTTVCLLRTTSMRKT
jgi:hypothetical protein